MLGIKIAGLLALIGIQCRRPFPDIGTICSRPSVCISVDLLLLIAPVQPTRVIPLLWRFEWLAVVVIDVLPSDRIERKNILHLYPSSRADDQPSLFERSQRTVHGVSAGESIGAGKSLSKRQGAVIASPVLRSEYHEHPERRMPQRSNGFASKNADGNAGKALGVTASAIS